MASPPPIQALPLSRLEAAAGLAIGLDGAASAVRADAEGLAAAPQHPTEALVAAIGRILARGRAYVSFSGGRDSSAVLAAATAAARRLGLEDPVPVTLRFPGIASTDESSWQEIVVEHLGLERWEVIEVGEELDLLGAIARRTLLDHGLLWPPNAYFHVPMLERARGASLMTGFDGDGLFGLWRWSRAQAVLHRRVRPVPRDAARVALALMPPAARRPLTRSTLDGAAPWLTPAGRRALLRAGRRQAAAEPRQWSRRVVSFYPRSRFVRLTVHSLHALGRAYEVEVEHPFQDAGFLAALARAGGAGGYADRPSVMRALFGDLLPEPVLTRRGKGEFSRALWRTEALEFAAGWDGSGIDEELVDPVRVREQWRSPTPYFGANTLLHEAWLAARRG